MNKSATAFEPPDDDALSRAIAEGRKQIAEGQSVSLADVKQWLESWGTSAELPPPPWK
jgi:predicted transcriptional regulator